MSVTHKRFGFALVVMMVMAAQYAYFRLPSIANDYGNDMAEWPLVVDLLVTLPLLYCFIFRPTPKAFAVRCLGILSLGTLFGSMVIPDGSKHIWRMLESAWPVLATGMGVLEVCVLIFVARRIRALTRKDGDVDTAMQTVLYDRFGRSGLGPLAWFEARIWYYGVLLRKSAQLRYRGEQHFSYHQHEGNASNQCGFIMIILFEMPLAHWALHLMASPMVAYIADALSLWTLLYLVAEYRATHRRPVSLDASALLIRCGVFATDRAVPYEAIVAVNRFEGAARRTRGLLRYRQCGRANVEIHLRAGSSLENMLGVPKPVERIVLGLDQPAAFIDALRARLAAC